MPTSNAITATTRATITTPMTPTSHRHGFTVGPLTISTATLARHAELLRASAEHGQGGWVVTLNTEMLARMAREPDYGALLSLADLCVADGMPLVWASQRQPDRTCHIPERTTGVDLVDHLLRARRVPSFAIIGGRDPRATLAHRYPRAQQACRFCFTGRVDGSDEQQIDHFAHQLERQDVRLLFLALGVPKQDELAVSLRERLPRVVIIGVGGTFEILGPQGARAPRWMRRSGLEWFYRFVREPGRLWRRYFLQYPAGIRYLLTHAAQG